MRSWIKSVTATAAMLACTAATPPGMDPDNPTCPAKPNWSDYKTMVLTRSSAAAKRCCWPKAASTASFRHGWKKC